MKSRYLFSSAVMHDSLYLLGGGGLIKNDTEVLDNVMTTAWRRGFNMTDDLHKGCAVKVSQDEIVVVPAATTKVVRRYNVATGEVKQFTSTVLLTVRRGPCCIFFVCSFNPLSP